MSLFVDIEKKYKDFTLRVNFQTEGGILGILGASGCGKSMTLKCIAGILTPDKGKIILNGRTLFDSERKINMKPQKRQVGYLFQDYALFPNMTVEENICCSMKRGDREKGKKWIELFRLTGLEKKYPSQLSGGQKQRTAFARMLAAEPKLLLLDEPFSALDSHLREKLQLEMKELLAGLGRDVILVTHSRDEAYRLCPSLLVMDKGEKVCQGHGKKLFKSPEYLEAARITGCKNLSPVERLDKEHVRALKWGLTLTSSRPLESGEEWVGIRAHDFYRASQPGENIFPVYLKEAIESPFEMYVIFGVSQPEKKEEKGYLWWKLSKEEWFGKLQEKMPPFLGVNPGDIMYLKTKKCRNIQNP